MAVDYREKKLTNGCTLSMGEDARGVFVCMVDGNGDVHWLLYDTRVIDPADAHHVRTTPLTEDSARAEFARWENC